MHSNGVRKGSQATLYNLPADNHFWHLGDLLTGSAQYMATSCLRAAMPVTALLCRMLDAAISAPGRQQLAQAFRLCNAASLTDRDAVLALQRDVLYSYQGFAQVT